jgi:hypothetical protein
MGIRARIADNELMKTVSRTIEGREGLEVELGEEF